MEAALVDHADPDVERVPGAPLTHMGTRAGLRATGRTSRRAARRSGTIKVDTSLVAISDRTYTGGPADYDAVHKIQDQYQLIPLSQWKGAAPNSRHPPACP
jgi:hypothetical protein